MRNVLNSIKVDLLSRRLLPIAAVVVLGLVGTLAYALLGGGASSSTSTPVAAAPSGATHLATVSETPANPNEAVAETPGGIRYQRQGGAHDPFLPLPVKKAAGKTKAAPKVTSTAPKSTSTPVTTPSKPTPKKAKPTTVYQVAVLFGPAATAPGQLPTLTPFENLKRLAPLPSASNPLIVFKGVSASGKRAVFVLVGEAILRGEATCLPSANQCEAIALAAGQTEDLSYLQPDGQTASFEIQVVSISKHEASPTAAARIRSRESHAGRELLHSQSLPILAELRYSPSKGVVVYHAHPHR